MRKAVAVVVAVLASPLLLAVGIAALVSGTPTLSGDPSEHARADIPPEALPFYAAAAGECPGLPWTVLAAIGKVETDHGRFRGARILVNGDVRPPIIGVSLDGSAGTRAIRDTDHGRLDGDEPAPSLHCSINIVLRTGQVTIQGAFTLADTAPRLAVTGGTGKYQGVHGQLTETGSEDHEANLVTLRLVYPNRR